MDKVTITSRGDNRDWSERGESFVRDIAKELSAFSETVTVRIEKEDGTVRVFIYLNGVETEFDNVNLESASE